MSKSLVGFGHLVCIFALLDGVAATVRGVEDLAGELVLHGLLATRRGVADQPADGQSGPAIRTHLDVNLVVRSTDAAALDLEGRLDVVDGLLEELDRIILGPILDLLEGA